MRKIILSLIALAVAPLMVWLDGAMLTDFKLRSETLVPVSIETFERKCRSKVFVLQICSYEYETQGRMKVQRYMMLALDAPEQLLMLRGMSSGQLTSNVGMEYFWNRVFSILFLFAFGLYSLRSALKEQSTPQSILDEVATQLEPGRHPAQTTPPKSRNTHQNGPVVARRRAAGSQKAGFGRRGLR